MRDYRIVALLSNSDVALVCLGASLDGVEHFFFAEAHEWFTMGLADYGFGLRALRYYIERWSPHPNMEHAGFWCRVRGLSMERHKRASADAPTTERQPINLLKLPEGGL